MAESWRTIRVFISSTFRDMQAERDHLVRFVFPRLREELQGRRITLDEVDLRWGVTAEQGVLDACREIIDECRPRFLCLLGGCYGTVPPGANRSVTADEVYHAVLDQPGPHGYAFFYLRDPAATLAMQEAAPGQYREPDGSEAALKLMELRQAIADARLASFVYPARWDRLEQRITGLEAFGERVRLDLLRSVDEEFGVAPAAAVQEFAEESAAMDEFIQRRAQHFVAGHRQPFLDQMGRFARGAEGGGLLLVTGPPGLGKTALLSRFCQDCAQWPEATLISHFVGASARSTDLRATLRRLCDGLARGAGKAPPSSTDLSPLRAHFWRLLETMPAERRVVLVIDAVNRFDSVDPDQAAGWLPRELPPGVKVVISSLPGAVLETLKRRFPTAQTLELPPLDDADARGIVDAFLARYRKRMTPEQVASLLEKPESRSPLYLAIALEELRTLGTHSEITERILSLPGQVRALVSWILRRLSADSGFRDETGRRVGADLIRGFALFLVASRYGLSAREMADLIAPRDPQGNVAALIALLRPYLMRRGELLDFYHDQFREAITAEQFADPEAQMQVHRRLAAYFVIQDTAPRGLSELPYHQGAAGLYGELETTLTDFRFLEAKCRAGMVFDLSVDYERAIAQWRGPVPVPVREFAGAFRSESYHLVGRPEMAFPQLCYHLQASADPGVRIALERGVSLFAQARRPWMRTLYRGGQSARLLTEHTEDVLCAAISNDGSIGVSASQNGQLKAYRVPNGEALWESLEYVPVLVRNVTYGHGEGPCTIQMPLTPVALAIEPGGNAVLLRGTAPSSCVEQFPRGRMTSHEFSNDLKWHSVRRDLKTGELLDRPPGAPPPGPLGVPRYMFRALGDGVVQHWNELQEESTKRSLGHLPEKTAVQCCWRSVQDTRMTLVAVGNRVELWDLQELLAGAGARESATGISRLEVSSQGPCALAVSGRRLLFWDFSTPVITPRTFDWPGEAKALALSECGSRMAWQDTGGYMVIAATSSGSVLARFQVGTESVLGCRFHSANELLVWGSEECSLWSLGSRQWQIKVDGYFRKIVNPIFAPPLLLTAHRTGSIYDVNRARHLCDLRAPMSIHRWSFDPVTGTLVTIHRRRRAGEDEDLKCLIWAVRPVGKMKVLLRSFGAVFRRIMLTLPPDRFDPLTGEPPQEGPHDILLCRPTSRGGLIWREGRSLQYKDRDGAQRRVIISRNVIADFSVSADGGAVAWIDENGTLGWHSLEDQTTIEILAAARMVSCWLDQFGQRIVALDLTGQMHVCEVTVGGGMLSGETEKALPDPAA